MGDWDENTVSDWRHNGRWQDGDQPTIEKDLPNSVFLDGDWCWDADPFQVTEETKEMVMQNICCLLNNFLHCTAYENVIFCWVMHKQSIIDRITAALDTSRCRLVKISLLADEPTLRQRLAADIAQGIRNVDVIDRSSCKNQSVSGTRYYKS